MNNLQDLLFYYELNSESTSSKKALLFHNLVEKKEVENQIQIAKNLTQKILIPFEVPVLFPSV